MSAHRTHHVQRYNGYLIVATPRPARNGTYSAGFEITRIIPDDPNHPEKIRLEHASDWQPLATEVEAVERAHQEGRNWIDARNG